MLTTYSTNYKFCKLPVLPTTYSTCVIGLVTTDSIGVTDLDLVTTG